MGRNKQGYNWKARQNTKYIIDNSSTGKVQIERQQEQEQKYDECNKFVLPSKKRTTKKFKDKQVIGKILSKTQKKKLEKILERKRKKADRSSILEALSHVQAPPEEINQLTSLAEIQTKGLKRHFIELNNVQNGHVHQYVANEDKTTNINSVAGSKKQKRILAAILNKNKSDSAAKDPNVVGFEASSSSEDEHENEAEFEVEVEPSEEYTGDLIKEEPGDECLVPDLEILPQAMENEKALEKPEVHKVANSSLAQETVTEVIPEKCRLPAVFVPVHRTPAIQEARMKLPVLAEEQTIMEVINENEIVIVAGETGSGKTTQIPQFLYEAGYARGDKLIGITQPRRVAAISMSHRVAHEMNLTQDEVSYLIRFEGNTTPSTRIKFMTDGVLLREIQSDFVLSKYSVVILDEAHERSVYTDILIGLLSRIVPLRKKKGSPLKLIIMSATLRVEDFTENTRLFKTPPPVITVESRQYPVSIHFNKTTADDYVKECYLKTCKIHTKLPGGGILVFVTGQQEVKELVRKLRRRFPLAGNQKQLEGDDQLELDLQKTIETVKSSRRKRRLILPDINLDRYSVVPTDDTDPDLFDDESLVGSGEEDGEEVVLSGTGPAEPLWVLPLYSLLPSAEQAKVFKNPPRGYRLCIVSTNVAETSLTIPNVKYVVDCGRTKARMYDKVTGVSTYNVIWCSKASANQRAGRAGRVGAGHCYRLYSSAVFNDKFTQFSVPEIQQKPVDDLVLQMKAMNIVKVVNFPFPSSPDVLQMRAAERRLRILGALQSAPQADEWSGKLTKLGDTMACFPVSPRYSKMLALSHQHDLLEYTVCLVAGLSVQEAMLGAAEGKQWAELRRSWAGLGNSLLLGDAMVLLRAIGAAEYSGRDMEQFCMKNGLRHKAMTEIRRLRVQLTNQINLNVPDLNLVVAPGLKPPTDIQAGLLRQIVLAGMADQVAHKVSPDEITKSEDKNRWKRAYRCAEMEDPVFLHSGSVLKKEMPEWVVFQEVYETNRLYMRGVTAIEPEWLPIFSPSLCNLSAPLTDPPPRYDSSTGKVHCHVTGTFGKAAFPLPTMDIPYTEGLDCYKWMAVFLLSGQVFTKLAKYKTSLLSSPASMTKSWAKLQPRTEILLKALVSKEANSRDKFIEIWSSEPSFLLEAYKAWLPESAHPDLIMNWPPTE